MFQLHRCASSTVTLHTDPCCCLFFFFLSCSPVVINLRVRQFEPEERFSLGVSNKVAMQLWRPSPSSQGGKGYFTWLGDECGVCGGASRLLAPSLSFLSISFFLLYYSSHSFTSPLPLSSHRSVTLFLVFSHLLSPSCTQNVLHVTLRPPLPFLF